MANPADTARSTMGYGTEGAASIGDRITDAASTAATTFEEGRAAAADSLKSAANYIGDKVGSLPGGESVQRTASAAADSVAASAEYLRDTDLSRMATDVEGLVKRNPGPSLVVAGVLGFLVGRSLSR